MIHAQIAIKTSTIKSMNQGDVVVVALPDHPWGILDKKRYLIVEWDDPALEKRLLDQRAAGHEFPVITYPYAVWKAPDPTTGAKQLALRSTEAVNVTAMADYQTLIADVTKDKPVYTEQDYTVKVQVAPADIQPGVVGTVVGAVASAWNWITGG